MSLDIHKSGYVRRWHSNPDLAHIPETLAHHQAQVAQIIFELHSNPSSNLIYEALHHDCGEMFVGDVSYTAKKTNPELTSLLCELEGVARGKMGCPNKPLSGVEIRWLNFADRLQSYRHVQSVAPHVLRGQEWVKLIDMIMDEADNLGIDNDAYIIG